MFNNNTLHIVGSGGFGLEIAYLLKCHYPDIHYFMYDDNGIDNQIRTLEFLIHDKNIAGDCVIAIGEPEVRRDVFNRMKQNSSLNFPNVDLSNDTKYPTSPLNSIGIGNIYMPGSIIGYNSQIGSFNILGANVGIGHDVVIGDFNFIGPKSFLAGNSKIGDFCKLSFGTFIMQNGLLCSNIKSMPYTAFYKKYKLPGTYFGNPAKSI
jgi:NDP-sugar pyrophosphorylase family protein